MRSKYIAIIIVTIFLSILKVHSQSEPMRLGAGFNGGAIKYWGEFTDNQYWLGGDMFLRWNILSPISLQATFGLAQARYKLNEDVFDKYPEYFGESPEIGDLYPAGGKVSIQEKNSIRINTYEIYLTYNFFPSSIFVPYIFSGIGIMNFEPRSGDTGFEGPLPNNSARIYDKTQSIIPVGAGFELYLTDDLVFNGRGTLRFTGTDYLDDLSEAEAINADHDDDLFLTFGLGLTYYVFGTADYDKDGLSNAKERELGTDEEKIDTDGDQLSDYEEYHKYNTDPTKQDTDSDNLSDYDEIFYYKTSPTKPDTDSDGIMDGNETARRTNPSNPDTDGDGLLDGEELNKYFTDPLSTDTDNDGLTDGEEISQHNTNPKDADTDRDGLKDGEEINYYRTYPRDFDTDKDGLSDGMEVSTTKTDPTRPDTDDDGLLDGYEINDYGTNPLITDTDADGLNDGLEIKTYKTDPAIEDTDKDGIKDGEEVEIHRTNPTQMDSDSDGLTDGDEINKYTTNPLAIDSDGDQLSDFDEINKYGTSAMNSDTDLDGLSDYDEIFRTNTDPNMYDTDEDGISDMRDDCPLVAGIQSSIPGENGCPKAPKVGTKADFPEIYFIYDKDEFNYQMPETSRNLVRLLEYVRQCEGLQVVIEGHASSEGDDKYNQKLSEKRAKRVKEWLLEQGVESKSISGYIGYGERQPKIKEPIGEELKKLTSDEIEAIRMQNRRITVLVTKTCNGSK